ncbi:MAG: methylamine utilization protein [Burkholderiaceae bacterium]
MIVLAQAARAAGVSVVVIDPAGNPLGDAVVTLEPVNGHLAAKPMNGVQIAQHDLQFDPQLTVVTVGTSVSFPNSDTVRHHVYSFSPVKTFQLKLYSGVAHAPITFDKPGIAVIGCNIHDQMVGWVVVVDTPLFARSSAGGRVRFDGVPAGSYRLQVWHPSLGESMAPVASALAVGAVDVERRIHLEPNGSAK